jgi:hypothetical protein
MQLEGSSKILATVVALALILSFSVSCGDSATVEPTEVSPPPEETLFESAVIPEATLPPLTVDQGFGGVTGVVTQFPSDWEGQELSVYLAPFFPGEEEGGGGIYILEPTIHSSTTVHSSGVFQMGNVEPGQYVVVFGPNAEDALVLLDGDRPRVIDIGEGTILELGELRLE